MNFVAKIEDVSHFYKKTKALDSVTLDIPSGSMVGFIGPDGVGKSTLLSIIAGVRKIQSGSVEVLGGDIKSASFRKKVSPRIAYMPQGLGKNLYMLLSVYENMEFFARVFGLDKNERKRRIDGLLKSIGLYEFKDRAVGKLSGGMKQKLGLCCALIHDPDLLILDEPTTGVDPLSRREFWKLIAHIRESQKGVSVLIATAYMQEAEFFDYIVAVNDGKILSQGTPQELLSITNTENIDSAFALLLPKEEKREYRDFQLLKKKEFKNSALAIEATELTKKFGDFTAVENVSFQIAQGEIFGFLGSNGCGKTTTMKMLTGLLSPTHGTIKLFGKSIKEHSLEMRNDVGYMTQSFSLYNELSVKQNLTLHAHLYRIKKSAIEEVVEDILERFYIKQYEDSLALDLPLGIKQRLSLAVAVIHKPKMLILDEPTSGVDPISRDMFWNFLIDLSQNDGVTIFISTHYMNEGERCDRVSLMHQGRVLASDTPEAIARSKDKENLEEAFVEYLHADMGKDDRDDITISMEKSSHKKLATFFSPLRFFGYIYRESLELIRDPLRLVFALLGTVILMFVMGYGVSMDVEDLKFSVLDYDQSPQSREYVEYISGSRYFLEQESLLSYADLDEKMKSGKIALAIEIPPNFGRDFAKGDGVEIGVWIDGTLAFRAETIKGYVEGLHYSYLESLSDTKASPLVEIETRYRYNQDFKSIYSMVPAVIPMLLVFIPSILMALSVVREKELGTIANFYATPVTKFEFLLGKQIPYVVISMISFLGLILLAVYVFKVPIAGNFMTLFFGALLFVTATTGMGFLMSAFTKTQISALGGTAIATLLPTIAFSGLRDPVSSLEGVGAFIGNIFPATYFINISRGIFSKNIGFEGHYFDFIAIALSIVVISFLSLMLLKKQER